MAVAKIHVLEGRYDEARLGRVSSAVQNGLITALGIPPEDFFQTPKRTPYALLDAVRSACGAATLGDVPPAVELG
jgi:hypothetical protein